MKEPINANSNGVLHQNAEALATLQGDLGLGAHALPSWPSREGPVKSGLHRRGVARFDTSNNAIGDLRAPRNLDEALAKLDRIPRPGAVPEWISTQVSSSPRRDSVISNAPGSRNSVVSLASEVSSDDGRYSTRPTSVASSASDRDSTISSFSSDSRGSMGSSAEIRAASAVTVAVAGRPTVVDVTAPRSPADTSPGLTLLPVKYGGPGTSAAVSASPRQSRLPDRPGDRDRGSRAD